MSNLREEMQAEEARFEAFMIERGEDPKTIDAPRFESLWASFRNDPRTIQGVPPSTTVDGEIPATLQCVPPKT